MKHVCKICGYVYDDAKEKVPFAELSDSWVCPVCGARKSDFVPVPESPAREQNSASTATDMYKAADSTDSSSRKESARTSFDDTFESDMKKLTAAQLSAICSNLARGCEKQYKFREQELFTKLAESFDELTPRETETETAGISELLSQDLSVLYQEAESTASQKADRGALRVCTWGKKVTAILKGLLERYEKEGAAFLADTNIWVCTVCGFVYVGDRAPELCPVCKVPEWKFEKIEGGEV